MAEQKIRYLSGWYPEEKGEFLSFRWMKKRAAVEIFDVGPPIKKRYLVFICGHPFHNRENPLLALKTGGKTIGRAEIFHSKNTYLFPLKFCGHSIHLELELDRIFENDKGMDDRELGIIVYKVAVHSLEKPPLPQSMELETTTYCDINPPCVMCYSRVSHSRDIQANRNLDDKVFEKIQPYLKDFEVISLHGIGEPLAGKNLFPILESIDAKKTKVQFNSNGLNLNEDRCRNIVEKGLSLINFSLDAATAATYKKIRRVDFNKVASNIRRLSEIKKEKSAKYPVIEMNMTLMRSNFEEATQFVLLAKGLGAEGVHFGILNRHPDDYVAQNDDFLFRYHQEMIDLGSPDLRAKIEEAREAANALGIKLYIDIPKE